MDEIIKRLIELFDRNNENAYFSEISEADEMFDKLKEIKDIRNKQNKLLKSVGGKHYLLSETEMNVMDSYAAALDKIALNVGGKTK